MSSSDWLKCRDYGLIEINPVNNSIRVFYERYSSKMASHPQWLTLENANWQGNNLMLHGRNSYGERKTVVMTDFFSYYEVI